MTANLDQICNDIRSRLSDCADKLYAAAAGTGAFADPQQVDLTITICLTVLETAQSQLRRDVLGKGP